MLAHTVKALVDYFDEKIHNAIASADRPHYPEELSGIEIHNSSKADGLLNLSSRNVINELD